jgi:hypothetical protein
MLCFSAGPEEEEEGGSKAGPEDSRQPDAVNAAARMRLHADDEVRPAPVF